MIYLNNVPVNVTTFPDGTSQVWKVEGIHPEINYVKWVFESEAEFVHVMQLAGLLAVEAENAIKTLYMPFLPYGRQDKEISNDTTWAMELLRVCMLSLYDVISTFDAHSEVPGIESISAIPTIQRTLSEVGASAVCYPDAGAKARYDDGLNKASICLEKHQDQSSGDITGMSVSDFSERVFPDSVLIVDDICDGGRTFIEATKLLKETYGPGIDVSLYVSHGIFSKGVDILREAGICNIFTREGRVV